MHLGFIAAPASPPAPRLLLDRFRRCDGIVYPDVHTVRFPAATGADDAHPPDETAPQAGEGGGKPRYILTEPMLGYRMAMGETGRRTNDGAELSITEFLE